jgi:hypothetical protein
VDPDIVIHERACQAFIEALRRRDVVIFSRNEIIISDRKKIGEPVICAMKARKGDGMLPSVTGTAYVYDDLVVVCVESVCKRSMEPIDFHHYEYLSC